MYLKKGNFFRLCSLICVLCAVVTGCASTEDVGKVQWELNALKSELKSIKQKSQSIETSIPGQKREVDSQLKELNDKQQSTAKTVSDLLIEFQDLAREFQKLTGQFEEARYFSEKSSAELIENKDILTAKISEMESALNGFEKNLEDLNNRISTAEEEAKKEKELAEQARKELEEKKKQEQARIRAAGPGGVKDAYMSAYRDYKQGNTKESRKKFLSVLSSYEENEYSDNARFWIAESYYKEGSYEDSILAYEELFKNNPDSDKVPGAMLKQGLAFYALKDKKTGKIVLEKLIEKYPDSEQAKLAKKKIKKVIPQKKKK